MEEQLITGFMSRNMWKGKNPYYGFYLTTDRIIGVKGFWGGNVAQGEWDTELEAALFSARDEFVGGPLVTDLGARAGLVVERQLSKGDAIKAIELLEDKKDVEVRRKDAGKLQTRRNRGLMKLWRWGKLIVRSPSGTHTINMGDDTAKAEVQRLKDMSTVFGKEKAVIEEK